MLAGIRADRAWQELLKNPARENPMVESLLSGEMFTLRARLATAHAANAALAREIVALKNSDTPWGETLGYDNMPRAAARSEGCA